MKLDIHFTDVNNRRYWLSRMHYSDDPFGVWYPVFSWLPAH
ncbi:MAG: hypothetical protein ABIQ09_06660 [Jatrophihabitantaceae bacterium]